MDIENISAQLKEKYTEIFQKYFEVLLKYKEEPGDDKIKEILNYLSYNLKYIEKYLSIIKMEDKEEMKKSIELNNFIKEINDTLNDASQEKENKKINENPRVEVINEM